MRLDSKKSNLFNRTAALRLFVLVACFSLLFAFVLFNGENVNLNEDGISVDSVTENVADALLDTDDAEGGTKSVYGNSGTSDITVENFVDASGNKGFPGTNGATVWYYDEGTIQNLTTDTVSVSATKNGGISDLSTSFSYNNTSITMSATGSIFNHASMAVAFNYKLSSSISTMIASDNFTVTATCTYSMSDTSGVSNQGIVQRDKVLKGADLLADSSLASGAAGSGTALTLSSSKGGYLSFAVYCDDERTVKFSLSNVSIKFTFTLKTNLTDSATTAISDGSAPVVASQYEKAVVDSYSPYITGTNASDSTSTTYISGSGNWPLYYDSIATNLSKATDSIVNGAGKLRSYTSTAQTFNSKSYYKYSKVTYLDTYNYAKTGSYSYATMQALTKEVSGTKVLDLDQIKTYLSYSGLSGAYPNTSTVTTDKVSKEEYLDYIANANYNYIAAGIKTVVVGSYYADTKETTLGAVFNIYDLLDNGSAIKTIYGTTVKSGSTTYKEIGQAKVTKTNRGKIVVECYMYGNDDVTTKVTDYGGLSVSKKITYSGIDTTTPTSGSSQSTCSNSGTVFDNSDYIKTDSSKVLWYRSSTFTEGMSIELYQDDSDDIYSSPYVWFLVAHRADTWDGLPTTATTLQYNKDKQKVLTAAGNVVEPIAYNSISSFTYDFSTGKVRGYNSASANISNPADVTDTVSGFGYYRFDIYLYDMVGNAGQVVTYFIKVDYETPSYDVDLSYVDDASKETVKITKDLNGAWATGETTLTLSSSKLNKSGNTFLFEDGAGNQHIIVINSTQGIIRYDSTEYTSGTTSITNQSLYHALEQTTKMNINYASNAGKYTLSFNFTSDKTNNADAYDDVAWIVDFDMYIGEYEDVDAIEADDMTVSYSNSDWKGGINVLIDRNNPVMPTFVDSNEETYINSGVNNYSSTITGTKVWWTGSLNSYGVILGFKDSLKESDYAADVKVYYGLKVVYNQSDLTTFKNLNVEKNYTSITKTDYSKYFDNLVVKSSDALDEENTEMSIDLLTIKNAGMRLIYVWAVDQAGNISELNKYFVLADATKYTVSSSVLNNASLEKGSAAIAQTNEDETTTTSFKRGEKVIFNLTFAQNYVAYKFNRAYGSSDYETVLINNSNEKSWTIVDNNNSKIFNASAYSTIEYTLDDPASIAGLEQKIAFQLAHREIVTYTVTSTSVVYTGSDSEVPISYSDVKAAGSMNVKFVDEDGNILYVTADGKTTTDISKAKKDGDEAVLFVPKTPATYYMITYIDKDDASYVTHDFRVDDNGVQEFDIRTFTITKGNITVTATPTTSTYGDRCGYDWDLKYTTEGIDTTADEYADLQKGKLLLNVLNDSGALITGSDYSNLSVGKYQIIEDPSNPFNAGEYFVVNFVSDFHTISAKQLTISVCANSKQYGEVDPDFIFSIATADVSETILGDAFDGFTRITDSSSAVEYGLTSYDLTNNAYFVAGSCISRESGESVGKYKFTSDTSLFDISTNYKLVVSTTNEFSIVARQISIDVSGQSTTVKYGTTIDATLINSIVPSYRLEAKDLTYTNAIASLLNGKLTLDSSTKSGSNPYSVTITLGSIDSQNFAISISGDKQYTIIVADAEAVIFKLKEGQAYSITYGSIWSDATSITFDINKFDVIYPEGFASHDIVSATWKVQLGTITDGNKPNAGVYLASIDSANVKLYSDGAQKVEAKFYSDEAKQSPVSKYSFVFVPFNVTVDQCVITVAPTAEIYTKVYGQSDDTYKMSYAIKGIGSLSATADGFDELSTDLAKTITGSFARALYEVKDSTNVFKQYGTRYDDVLVGTSNFYSFAEMQTFQTSNTNYKVVVDLTDATALTITPYELALSFSKVKGISKAYDGTTNVTYTNVNKAYELTKVLASDDVELSYIAAYTSVENTAKGYVGIILANLGLTGTKANNYMLSTLTYDLADTTKGKVLINGEVKTEKDKVYVIDSTLSLEIIYLSNDSDSADFIQIIKGKIGVHKSDITISKQYDGTKSFSISNVTIKDRTDEDNLTGTSMLCSALKNATLVEGFEYDNEYSDYTISTNYVLSICLKFPMSTNGIEAVTDGAYASESDVTVLIEEDCVKVIIVNAAAAITQRVINGDSFETIVAEERDYNAQADVTSSISFTLKDSALADGDTLSDIDITLGAKISGTNYNAGRHAIEFVKDTTKVVSTNYTVDIDSLNLTYTGDKTIYIDIAKAKLMPNVTFEDKTYDLTSTVTSTYESTLHLTTLRYAGNLESELNDFVITDPTFVLSNKGVETGAVMLDDEGNVTGHNVLVKGLKISLASGSKVDLSNYEIYGYRYNDGKYIGVGSFESDVTISDYEILDALTVEPKTLTILQDKITISSKVYDGEKTTSVTIDYDSTEYSKYNAELQYLYIQGNGSFARSQVGSNISVIINDVELVVKDAYAKSSSVNTYTAFINNYKLSTSKIKKTEAIKERPVLFTATLATREYDGTAVASKVNYELSFIEGKDATEKLTKDLSTYSVQTAGGAFFSDKNAGEDKSGVIYNPTLRSSKSKFINYVLCYESNYISGSDAKMVAYKSEDGVITYYPSDSFIGTLDKAKGTYYYTLPTAKYYVKSTDYDESTMKSSTIGYYSNGYMLSSALGTYTTLSDITYYTNVKGTIEPKSVYISSDGIVVNEGKKADFIKNYDGTTAFNGTVGIKKLDNKVYYLDKEVNADSISCYYDLAKGISGVLEGDSITIGNIQAQYSSANTTAKYVIFQASSISGDDASNYTYAKTSVSCKVAATINPLDITVILTDTDVEYGTNTQSLVREDLDYYMGQNVYKYIGQVSSAADVKDGTYYEITFKAADSYTGEVYYTIESGKYILQYGITKEEFDNTQTTTTYYTATLSKAYSSLYKAEKYYCELIDESAKTKTEKELTNAENIIFEKGYEIIWDKSSSSFYMNYKEFLKVVGLTVGTTELQAQTYNAVDDSDLTLGFEPAAKGVDGTYLKIASSVTLPKSKGTFASPKPQAGDTTKSYTLSEAYNTNFTYVPRYTGNGTDGTSVMSIYKKDMYISLSAGSDVVMTYAGSTTATTLTYLNENGNSGIVSGETWLSIFKKGNYDYRPIVKYALVTVSDSGKATYTEIGKYPTLSKDLKANQYYVMYLDKAEYVVGENTYSTMDVASNYNVYLPEIEYDAESKKFYYAYYNGTEKKSFTASALEFSVELPTLSNISIGDSTGLISLEYTYDGNEKLSNVVMGYLDGDTVTIDGKVALNAGEYKGYVTLERDVKVDDEDPNGYSISWTSAKEITLKINKADPSLSVAKGTKYYDGKEYIVYAGAGEAGDAIVNVSLIVGDEIVEKLDKKYIDITKYLVVSGKRDTQVTTIKEAGTYKIVATLNDVFAEDYPNYNATSEYALYTVMQAPVAIDFSLDSDTESLYKTEYVSGTESSGNVTKVIKFIGNYNDVKDYADSNFGIMFDASINDDELKNVLSISDSDVELIFNTTVNASGKYSFTVQFKDEDMNNNYTLVNNTGILELTTNSFSSEGGSVVLEKGIVANKLVVNELTSSNKTASDNQYWASIDAFMPYVGDNAYLASVVRLSLYYDNQLVSINGTSTRMSINVPENLSDYDMDTIRIYEVTQDGGLTQIEYEIIDGKIVYTTTTLGDLVFVSSEPNNTPAWVLALVVVVPIAIVLFVGAFVLAFVIKRNKLKKLLM